MHKDQIKLPAATAHEFRDLCVQHVTQQKTLNDLAGRPILNVTFKHHLLIHAGQRTLYQNPRMGFEFQGGDLMG